MIKKTKIPKIFSGWWIVLTSGLLALWGYGYYMYGFSALFKPISSELGFNRTTTSIAASIGRFEGGIEAPLTGWITDRFGPRGIVIGGIVLISLGLILMNFIQSLWAYYVVWGLIIGTGINTGLSLPLDTSISNWFVKKRGLALGIKWVFSGLSGVIVLPLIAWLIYTQGWRMACTIGGLTMLFIGLPLVWFTLKRHRPEYYGLLPDGATMEVSKTTDTDQILNKGIQYAAEAAETEFAASQALRTRSYWMLIISNACHSLVQPVVSIHGIPFLTDIGIDPIKAAGMMSLMVGVSIPCRLVGGMLADRVKKQNLRFIQAGAYLLQAVGFILYLVFQTNGMIYVWFVFFGIGMGIGYGIMSPLRARYFGRKAFGSIAGFSSLFMAPIGIVAPIYLGWVYDSTGSYISGFTVVTGLLSFATLLSAFILPPKPPSEITDIRKIM
ncbi:MAG: MFS transporter [Dehalococcoidales bacterium]|nr:MFS transporter [Dehalococcoidales bacterium]